MVSLSDNQPTPVSQFQLALQLMVDWLQLCRQPGYRLLSGSCWRLHRQQRRQRPGKGPGISSHVASSAARSPISDSVDSSVQLCWRPIPDPCPKLVVRQTSVPSATRLTGVSSISGSLPARPPLGLQTPSPASCKTPRGTSSSSWVSSSGVAFLHDPLGVF